MSDSILHEPKWPALWVRAAMRTAILSCLEAGPLHGYAIALALEGIGFGRPKGGSLYPILEELKAAGTIEDEWERHEGTPGRRVYRLTEDGTARLHRERAQWQELASALVGNDGTDGSAVAGRSESHVTPESRQTQASQTQTSQTSETHPAQRHMEGIRQ